MSLSDLTEHIPHQNNAISFFTRGVISTTGFWPKFWECLWDKGLDSLQQQEPVERDFEPIEDTHILPDALPVTRTVAILPGTLPDVWGLDSQDKILVRSEYHEAEKAVLLSNESGFGVFVVDGQPGIGPLRPLSTAFAI